MLLKSFSQEWDNLIRNKMNLVMLFILPIVIVLLVGATLSQGVIRDIPMAVIDYDNSAFSRQLIDSFDQNETFSVIGYPTSEDEMESLIRNSKARVGMVIPRDFYNDVSQLKSPRVEMFYDGSHMSMTSTSKAKAMEILLTYKAGATIKQLSGRLGLSYDEAFNITQAFQFGSRRLYNATQNFEYFLAPILMAGAIQTAIALVSAVAFSHDMYDEERRSRLGYATGKILFYGACGTVSYLICILIQIKGFGIPFRGSLVDAIVLSAGLSLAVSAFSVMISSLMKTRIIAMVAAAVVFIPNSIMAGTTWPLISMPVGYQGFAKIMPFARYVNNIRAIYLKGIGMDVLRDDVLYLFAFGLGFICLTEIVVRIVPQNHHQEELIDEELCRVV